MRAFEQAHGAAFDSAAVKLVEQIIRRDQIFLFDLPRRKIRLLRLSTEMLEEPLPPLLDVAEIRDVIHEGQVVKRYGRRGAGHGGVLSRREDVFTQVAQAEISRAVRCERFRNPAELLGNIHDAEQALGTMLARYSPHKDSSYVEFGQGIEYKRKPPKAALSVVI